MAVKETAVSVVTGAINSVVDKLTGLLADEVSSLVGRALLGKDVKLGIQYMRDELSSMRAVLLRLSAVEEHIDPLTKQWKERVQDMSFEIEDCIDRFMERRRRQGSSQGGGLVSKAVRKLKSVWDDLQTGQEIENLKAMVAEESERRKRNNDFEQFLAAHPPRPPVSLDPGLRTQDVAARNLVGMDGPREKIFGWLAEQDTQPKVVAIYGIGGSGKTTLALEVYNKIQEPFDCRAFVAVSQTPDNKAIFKHMLFQVISEKEYNKCQTWDPDQLRLKLRQHLKNKRYLIVIDDVWTSSAWRHVKSALPIDNNKRSRIVATTRSKDVASSICADMDGHMYDIPEQIGNLHHLEVLDIRACLIEKLPATIVQLKKLVCLFFTGSYCTPLHLPDGIGDLQCLEELSQIELCGASVRSLEGLGELTKLRALGITWGVHNDYSSHIEEDRLRVFASSLFKLVANSLRSLRFTGFHNSDFLNSWVFPSGSCAPPIQRLVLTSAYGTEDFEFPAIPSQISSLTNLTRLRLSRVREMGEDGVNILASLPMLLSLTLHLGYGVRQLHVISSQGFKRLVKLKFDGETLLTFEGGAMPKLERLKLVLSRPEQYNPGGFVQGLLHLSSLKHMSIFKSCPNTERVMEDLMNEIRNATSNLPNHPILVDKYSKR